MGQERSSHRSLLVLSSVSEHRPPCSCTPSFSPTSAYEFFVLCVPGTGSGPGTAPSGRSEILWCLWLQRSSRSVAMLHVQQSWESDRWESPPSLPLAAQNRSRPWDPQGPMSPAILAGLRPSSWVVGMHRGVPDHLCLTLRKVSHQSGTERKGRGGERERNINQKWAREATPSLPQMTLRLRERQACSQKPQGKETGLKGERMRKPCHLVVIPHTPAPWRRYVKSETFKEWGTIWRVPS